MSHFMPKPRPPMYVGRDTMGQAVDSSAIVWVSGKLPYASLFSARRNWMAPRFSRPPNSLGIHSPCSRE
jgi:hypothetical protein